jgi:hypothetical protein
MKKHTVANKQANVLERERSIDLDYSLILTDRNKCDLIEEDTVYSILILQTEGGITTEYDFLYDVARDEENAVAILDLLVYNGVMPSNARDVLADYL